MSKKRFYYHYFRQNKCLSIHYNKSCTKVNNIICNVPTESKWNNTQPNLVLRGYCNDITYHTTDVGITAIIK